MADKTNLFKATIKTFKAREKSIYNTPADKQADKSILKKSQKSEFAIAAKNVAGLITKLKEFLLEIRKNYLNDASFLGITQPTMSDFEWEKIDAEAKTFMKKCKDAIKQLAVQASRQLCTKQARENKSVILELLDRYLAGVCKMYSQHKAIRMKREIDHRRISRLQLEPIFSLSKLPNELTDERGDASISGKALEKPSNKIKSNPQKDSNAYMTDKKPDDFHPQHLTSDYKQQLEQQQQQQQQEPEMSKEEMVQLMSENEQLFESMSTMVDEVKTIEGKMVEISQLQELFTEKILEQDKDIDRLAETVVSSSENIREANDEIREAMKNNAGFRVWILFFLLVCTFSLLFLDWYNV